MSEKHTFSCIGDLAGVLKTYQKRGRILLLTHERPDGDAVGSLCGLYEILKENAWEADLFLPGDVPDMYRSFLPENILDHITVEELEKKYVLLLFLDCANQSRCSLPALKEGNLPLPSMNIDHHPDNTSFASWNCFNASAAACCEVLYALACACNWKISRKAATLLLLGLTTDCGCFRYDNTTSETLRTASALMDLGADRHRIIEECYQSKPENLALLESELLCFHLQKDCGGDFAYMYIAPELLEKYSVDVRNTEQLIECIRQLKSVKACAVIRKEANGFKISLRSKVPAVSAGRIARNLGGGGHEMAAGCTVQAATEKEAADRLLEEVRKEIQK